MIFKPNSLVDGFYEDPTPAKACALAAADHRANAGSFVSYVFLDQLARAERIAQDARNFATHVLSLEVMLRDGASDRQQRALSELYRLARGIER